MKKLYISLIIIIFISLQIKAQTIKKVIFLGNSYTYVNDLPLVLSNLAKSTGDSLFYNSNTPGGYTLQGHSTNPTSLSLIQQGGWDLMVLQEQSQLPSFPISQVLSQSYPYSVSLCNNFYQHNPCGQPLFFMTWGRKNGDQSNCATWPPVCTYAGMDSLLNLRYRMYADSNQALVSPVGAVWHYIRNHHPNIDLYSSDQSHPSMAGTYAAATTFYSLIFQKDPTNIKDDQGLSSTVAMDIRAAAKIIAFDSLAKWNMGKFSPVAGFSYSSQTDTILFHNTSLYAANFVWDFGDGDTAVTSNPVHIYKAPGTYKVILKAIKCNVLDTTSLFVTILPNGMIKLQLPQMEVYPNPSNSIIHIRFSQSLLPSEILLFSIDGRRIRSIEAKSQPQISVDISDLKSGIYFIGFAVQGVAYRYKVVKI
ncbi:MAG: hypothetical protein DRI74_04990 [Bacteroidetes bacterium]|nr:MAG: hypothetical protein DRI74_04990 [Bacteroidota bacterium]